MQKFAIATLLALGSIASAQAASITGLYNTGAGATSSTLYDMNYLVTASSTPNAVNGGAVAADNFQPIAAGTWMANSTDSKWLTPSVNANQNFDSVANGVYSYRLTFDLTGFLAETANFTVQMAAEQGYLKLNGKKVVGSDFSGTNGFTGINVAQGTTKATKYFKSGVNTLEFVVNNKKQVGGSVTGLRAEFIQSYVRQGRTSYETSLNSVSAVPEPESYAMLLAGLGLMGTIARRRKQA